MGKWVKRTPETDKRRRKYPPLSEELQALCVEHDWLVHDILFRLGRWRAKKAGIQLDDLIQAGRLGLIYAARRYDPSKGFQFNTLARHAVLGQMLECIDFARFGRKNVHKKLIDQSIFVRLPPREGGEDDPW